jgi:hypothetical protein
MSRHCEGTTVSGRVGAICWITFCIYRPWLHKVRRDASCAQIASKAACHPAQRRLARRVKRAASTGHSVRNDTSDRNDPAACDHQTCGFFCSEEWRSDIESKSEVERVIRVFLEWPHNGCSSNTDKNVEATEMCRDLIYCAVERPALLTSAWTSMASVPPDRISSARRSASLDRLRYIMPTEAPSTAILRLIAAPMPRVPPMTMATFPFKTDIRHSSEKPSIGV